MNGMYNSIGRMVRRLALVIITGVIFAGCTSAVHDGEEQDLVKLEEMMNRLCRGTGK